MPLKLSQMLMQNKPAAGMSADMAPQKPQMDPRAVSEVIGKYNSFGKRMAGNVSLREIAAELMQIAEMAEATILQAEGTDWFDGHTVQRNIKEMKSYVKEISKISEEYDSLHMRARALVDDCGRVLERYFDIADDELAQQNVGGRPELQTQYDTDDDQEADLKADNTPTQQVGSGKSKMFHEDETGQAKVTSIQTPQKKKCYTGCGRDAMPNDSACQSCANYDSYESGGRYDEQSENLLRAKDLTERIVSLARHRLTGEQLNKFDTLKKEIQIRAAWKIIR